MATRKGGRRRSVRRAGKISLKLLASSVLGWFAGDKIPPDYVALGAGGAALLGETSWVKYFASFGAGAAARRLVSGGFGFEGFGFMY